MAEYNARNHLTQTADEALSSMDRSRIPANGPEIKNLDQSAPERFLEWIRATGNDIAREGISWEGKPYLYPGGTLLPSGVLPRDFGDRTVGMIPNPYRAGRNIGRGIRDDDLPAAAEGAVELGLIAAPASAKARAAVKREFRYDRPGVPNTPNKEPDLAPVRLDDFGAHASYYPMDDKGRDIGKLSMMGDLRDPKNISFYNIEIDPAHRRRGITASIYDEVDAAARQGGRKIVPSSILKDDGFKFWLDRDPWALLDHPSVVKNPDRQRILADEIQRRVSTSPWRAEEAPRNALTAGE